MPSSGVLGRSGGQDAQADFIRERMFYHGWQADDRKQQNDRCRGMVIVPQGLIIG